MKQIALDIGLSASPTLAGFLAGPNQAALDHLQLWVGDSARPSIRSPVPTYLWGDSGSGKSHLLLGVREALQQQGAQVGWLDATLTEPPAFSAAWSVVIFDDVQRYNAVQQHAAFNWFVNALSPADGVPRGVLAAGAMPPADLPLREDLRTRLGWGHVFMLQTLDDAARRAVLKQQADGRGLLLPDEVVDFVLNRFSRDLGSLMQLLNQLDAYSLQTQRGITIPLVKAMLDNT